MRAHTALVLVLPCLAFDCDDSKGSDSAVASDEEIEAVCGYMAVGWCNAIAEICGIEAGHPTDLSAWSTGCAPTIMEQCLDAVASNPDPQSALDTIATVCPGFTQGAAISQPDECSNYTEQTPDGDYVVAVDWETTCPCIATGDYYYDATTEVYKCEE